MQSGAEHLASVVNHVTTLAKCFAPLYMTGFYCMYA
jgi:hypothetical protein